MAATRVCPQTMTGLSRDSKTMLPRRPNFRMLSATLGMALSLWRALRP